MYIPIVIRGGARGRVSIRYIILSVSTYLIFSRAELAPPFFFSLLLRRTAIESTPSEGTLIYLCVCERESE